MKTAFTYSEQEIRDIVQRNYARIVSYIRKLLGKQSVVCDAEDIFQDALCQFIEKKAEITPDNSSMRIFPPY